jgi:hypothetical protein
MKIKDIAHKLNIQILVPEGQSLERINAITDSGTILFNLKPLFHLNIIHFALFSYLKILTENNFKCTIVLQDLMTANGDFLDEINTQDEANVAMDMLYKRLKKFSINLNNIEIIPESGLLRLYNRGERRFFYDLIKLSSKADKVLNNSAVLKSFDHIDSMCAFLYESFLKPDFVVTGGDELNTIWYQMRKRGNLSSLFGDSYNSPVMLVLPNIYKHDKKELISTLDKNDPFCENFHFSKEMITETEYINKIQLLNREIKLLVSNEPQEIINQFKSIVY